MKKRRLTIHEILEAEEWKEYVFIQCARLASKDPTRRAEFLRFAAPEIKILEAEAELIREIYQRRRGTEQ